MLLHPLINSFDVTCPRGGRGGWKPSAICTVALQMVTLAGHRSYGLNTLATLVAMHFKKWGEDSISAESAKTGPARGTLQPTRAIQRVAKCKGLSFPQYLPHRITVLSSSCTANELVNRLAYSLP